jgi:UDP-N-acetylenolpyruvoylglucosamine reductase
MISNDPIPARASGGPVLPEAGAHVHMAGVCGTGMTPLALCLRAAGYRVSGQDAIWPAEAAGWLERAGVERTDGAGLPAGVAVLVHSSAVKPDHAARVCAREQGVPALRRGEALAALVRGRPLVAVAGSHGKTTTTAMAATALCEAGIACDWLLGGLFADGETAPARWRGKGVVVAEIDESDGTIGGFAPEILLCVNVDWDHCDHYRDAAAIEAAFAALARRTRAAVLFNAGCAASRRVFAGLGGPAAAASFGPGGDYELVGATAAGERGQTLRLGGRFGACEAQVAASGAFNALDACGALAAAAWLGAGSVGRLLARYPGVRRRQAVLPSRPGVTVVEDYAHHPAEIDALLRALREREPRRLVVAFQPHRFTRTARFREGFAAALARADRLFLLEVYPAGETPVPGGSANDVAAALAARDGAPRAGVSSAAGAADAIVTEAREGDLIAFVGAGDIDGLARAVAARLAGIAEAPPDSRRERFRGAFQGRVSPETAVRFDEPLGPKTTIGVGGVAEAYAEPANTADLQALLEAARSARMPVSLIGRGSNLVVPDEGVGGLVLRLHHPHWRRFICLGPGRYWAGAGLRLKELCGMACRLGEAGFEFLEGIPGTVGGALRMNAGAMGQWMFDVVEHVHFLGTDGTLRIRARDQLAIGYRCCAELENGIALGAVLCPAGRAEGGEIRARIEAYQERRTASQPREPSAGCIFRNPPGDSAGRIIDQLGLKGLRVGGAEVSPVHANFIINRGHATGSDVIALVRRVRDEVRARRNIELEPEVVLCGRAWKEVL